jgi:hypothetical protein
MSQPNNRFWKDWSKKERWLFALILVVIVLCIVYAVLNIDSILKSWKNTFTPDFSSIRFRDFLPVLDILIPPVLFFILFIRVTKFRWWISRIIGEGLPYQQFPLRYILPIIVALPICYYVLLSSINNTISPVTQFSLVAISPTLGGLVLTASNGKTIKRQLRNRLVAIAQKLILVTILLILFSALIVFSDIFGGIELTNPELSFNGISRWLIFWGATWSFFIGVYLFLLSLVDLVYTLSYLRK